MYAGRLPHISVHFVDFGLSTLRQLDATGVSETSTFVRYRGGQERLPEVPDVGPAEVSNGTVMVDPFKGDIYVLGDEFWITTAVRTWLTGSS